MTAFPCLGTLVSLQRCGERRRTMADKVCGEYDAEPVEWSQRPESRRGCASKNSETEEEACKCPRRRVVCHSLLLSAQLRTATRPSPKPSAVSPATRRSQASRKQKSALRAHSTHGGSTHSDRMPLYQEKRSGGETRTLNLAVNSRLLCRLSYPGNSDTPSGAPETIPVRLRVGIVRIGS
jgi:hypothetical protein